MALNATGQYREALPHFEEAVKIEPDFVDSHVALAAVLVKMERRQQAISQLQEVLRLQPDSVSACFHLARLQLETDRVDEAKATFELWLDMQPPTVSRYLVVAKALDQRGYQRQAVYYYKQAIDVDSEVVEAQLRLGVALETIGDLTQAVKHYRECLRLTPEDVRVLNNLAWILASHPDPRERDGDQARRHAQVACQITKYQQPETLDTLAAALAESGDFSAAVETANKAITLASRNDQAALVEQITRRLQQYQQGRPWVQEVKANHGE